MRNFTPFVLDLSTGMIEPVGKEIFRSLSFYFAINTAAASLDILYSSAELI